MSPAPDASPRRWRSLPAWLIALGTVPLLAGAARLAALAGAGDAAVDRRFVDSPLPVSLHVVAAVVYCLAGAFQFDESLRRRHPAWHRRLGWLVLVCGAVVALTAAWMAVATAIPAELQGELLRVVRVLVAAGMGASLGLALVAIRAGRWRAHRAWMARAYALALGAGTQVLLLLPPALVLGAVVGPARDVLMSLAWLLNLCVAEWALARDAVPA